MISQKKLILGEEWDILIILDACRYDFFEEIYGGKLGVEKVRSEGSCTVEWFYKTFAVEKVRHENVIYISGTPYVSHAPIDIRELNIRYRGSDYFYKVDDVWKYGWVFYRNAYIVSPFAVYTSLLINSKHHRDKKFIVHFMQPHAPYPLSEALSKYFVNDSWKPDLKLWDALRDGRVSRETVVEAYKGNIRYVMEYVFKIADRFRGLRIAVTSDHGECFGEHGLFNHPCRRYVPVLVDVPWVTL